ncbi:hypothetical protein [Spiribacter vilamensis]|uniref:Uncharacterized protein n=1 Tax=Spiribacter vilamensis TaxID=531306 RepID=A0A4Q8D0N1_9GAMM|nr:hypothetical protein [Spiribacter vilamensis]RZU98886.1 hypothetical protein EV698_1150 [Spiribacter vilamensis]TVO62099.1 hypothetical protein FPL09_08465 [Spiribacter vilamensis]
MASALSATPAVLTVELKPEHIMRQRPPEALSRDNAELLAAPIADDLRRIVGEEIAEAGLVMPAALYDLTELLRPGLPMVEALLDIYRGSLRGGSFIPQLLTLGSNAGRFPESAIAPLRRPGSGPLLVIPFALVAPGEQLDPLRQKLESVLLEKGRAGLATDRALRQLMGIEPVNLSYATFHDLSALMKVQLEHAEFGPLWQLIEAALYRPDSVEDCQLETGNRFIGSGGAVWTPWMSFDAWASNHQSAPEDAIEGYGAWMRNQRQYMAGFESHGMTVHPVIPTRGGEAGDPEIALSVAQAHAISEEQPWYREIITENPQAEQAAIVTVTEQADPELGPVAYTALVQAADGELITLVHDYPVRPEGMQAIIGHWQARAESLGATWQMERPGRINAAGNPAYLQPWLNYEGNA